MGDPLPAPLFDDIRRCALLEGCKWDPQVGDTATLAPFPLVISQSTWRQLATWAEGLAAEALAAEAEVVAHPALASALGLPRRLRQGLLCGNHQTPTPSGGRVMRWDFHWTTDGWRISECNSDVPGGFTEGSHFALLMAEHYEGTSVAGDAASAWVERLAAAGGAVALLCDHVYMEDVQVAFFLAQRLRARGVNGMLATPGQLGWRDGVAYLREVPLQAIVRVYLTHWLPRERSWQSYFWGGRTAVANPASAVVVESKRFPLIWDRLRTPLPTWRALLPSSCDVRQGRLEGREWVLKLALSDCGERVILWNEKHPWQWRKAVWAARLQPHLWVAQRRFEAVAADTPWGALFPCIGVFTVDGRSVGAYARLSRNRVTNFEAVDVALLVA